MLWSIHTAPVCWSAAHIICCGPYIQSQSVGLRHTSYIRWSMQTSTVCWPSTHIIVYAVVHTYCSGMLACDTHQVYCVWTIHTAPVRRRTLHIIYNAVHTTPLCRSTTSLLDAKQSTNNSSLQHITHTVVHTTSVCRPTTHNITHPLLHTYSPNLCGPYI